MGKRQPNLQSGSKTFENPLDDALDAAAPVFENDTPDEDTEPSWVQKSYVEEVDLGPVSSEMESAVVAIQATVRGWYARRARIRKQVEVSIAASMREEERMREHDLMAGEMFEDELPSSTGNRDSVNTFDKVDRSKSGKPRYGLKKVKDQYVGSTPEGIAKFSYRYTLDGTEFLTDKNSFNMDSDSEARQFMFALFQSSWVENSILLCIVTQTFFLMASVPGDAASNEALLEVGGLLDKFFLGIYTVEMLARMFTLGIYKGRDSYIRSGWNQLDGFLVLASWAYILLAAVLGANTINPSVLRVIRCLRPMRSAGFIHGVRSAMGHWPFLVNVGLLLIFLMCMFGVLGMQLFGGALSYECMPLDGMTGSSDGSWLPSEEVECPPMVSCPQKVVGAVEMCIPNRNYANEPLRWGFDNIGISFLTGWVVTTGDLWAHGYITEIRTSISKYNEQSWRFFIAMSISLNLIISNLFAAVVVHSFLEESGSEADREELRNKIRKERQLFMRIDSDNSGEIQVTEIKTIASVLGLDATHFADHELEQAMIEMDVNGDGSVDFEEFAHWWDSNTTFVVKLKKAIKRTENRIREVWIKIDVNNDNALDEEEIQQIGELLGIKMSPYDVATALREMLGDRQPREASFEVFSAWWYSGSKIAKKIKASASARDQIAKRLFQRLDLRNSGDIDVDDILKSGRMAFGHALSHSEAVEFVQECLPMGGHKVSLQHFEVWWYSDQKLATEFRAKRQQDMADARKIIETFDTGKSDGTDVDIDRAELTVMRKQLGLSASIDTIISQIALNTGNKADPEGVYFTDFFEWLIGSDELALKIKSSFDRLTAKRNARQQRPPPFVPYFSPLCRTIAYHKYFEAFITFMIILNTAAMSATHYGQDPSLTDFLILCEFYFSTLYVLEFLIKFFGMGWRAYFSDHGNKFDFAVTASFIGGLFLDFGSSSSALRSLRVLVKCMRVARSAKILARYETVATLLKTMMDKAEEMVTLAGFAVFMMLVLSIVGGHTLGNCHLRDDGTVNPSLSESDVCDPGQIHVNMSACLPVNNYYYFSSAFHSNFLVMMGEDWSSIMYNYEDCTRGTGVIFFVLVYLVMNFFVANLFVALIVEGFCLSDEEKLLKQEKHHLKRVAQESGILQLMGEEHLSSKEMMNDAMGVLKDGMKSGNVMKMMNKSARVQKLSGPMAKAKREMGRRVNIEAQLQTMSKLKEQATARANQVKEEMQKQAEKAAHAAREAAEHAGGAMMDSMMDFVDQAGAVVGDLQHHGASRVPIKKQLQDSLAGMDRESLITVFEEFDDDNSGTLSREELHSVMAKVGINVPPVELNSFFGLMGTHDQNPEITLDKFLDIFDQTVGDYESELLEAANALASKRKLASWNLFTLDNPIRKLCIQITDDPKFETTMMLLIGFSSLCLAAEGPAGQSHDSTETFLFDAVNIGTLAVFTLEFFMKTIANGFVKTPSAYIKERWNQIDFFVLVMCSLEYIGSTTDEAEAVRVLRLLRVLRPLRLMKHNDSMSVFLTALTHVVPVLAGVVLLMLIFFTTYAIFGLGLFLGRFRFCNCEGKWGLPVNDCQHQTFLLTGLDPIVDKITCLDNGGTWENPPFNFDNFFGAVRTLFVMAQTGGWNDVIKAGTSVGQDFHPEWGGLEPEVDKYPPTGFIEESPIPNSSWAYIMYFWTFIIINQLFIMNIFIGILTNYFLEADGAALLTESQSAWAQCQIFCLMTNPRAVPKPEAGSIKRVFYDIVHHPLFEPLINIVIIVNVVVLFFDEVPQDQERSLILSYIQDGCLVLFSIDMVTRLVCMGFYLYWKDHWNKLDLVIVLTTLMSKLGGAFAGFAALRGLRVMRLFVVAKQLRTLRPITRTILISVPSCSNVIALLSIFIFVYGVAGMNLYGLQIDHDVGHAITEVDNFDDFGHACAYLIQITCGQDWLPLVYELENKGLVAPFAFFGSFVVVTQWVFLNLFIVTLIDNFMKCFILNKMDIQEEHIDTFKDIWCHGKSDPNGPFRGKPFSEGPEHAVCDVRMLEELVPMLLPPTETLDSSLDGDFSIDKGAKAVSHLFTADTDTSPLGLIVPHRVKHRDVVAAPYREGTIAHVGGRLVEIVSRNFKTELLEEQARSDPKIRPDTCTVRWLETEEMSKELVLSEENEEGIRLHVPPVEHFNGYVTNKAGELAACEITWVSNDRERVRVRFTDEKRKRFANNRSHHQGYMSFTGAPVQQINDDEDDFSAEEQARRQAAAAKIQAVRRGTAVRSQKQKIEEVKRKARKHNQRLSELRQQVTTDTAGGVPTEGMVTDVDSLLIKKVTLEGDESWMNRLSLELGITQQEATDGYRYLPANQKLTDKNGRFLPMVVGLRALPDGTFVQDVEIGFHQLILALCLVVSSYDGLNFDERDQKYQRMKARAEDYAARVMQTFARCKLAKRHLLREVHHFKGGVSAEARSAYEDMTESGGARYTALKNAVVRQDADTASAKIGNLIQGEQVVALQEESLPDGEKGNRVLIHLIRRVDGNVMHLQGWVSKVSESGSPLLKDTTQDYIRAEMQTMQALAARQTSDAAHLPPDAPLVAWARFHERWGKLDSYEDRTARAHIVALEMLRTLLVGSMKNVFAIRMTTST